MPRPSTSKVCPMPSLLTTNNPRTSPFVMWRLVSTKAVFSAVTTPVTVGASATPAPPADPTPASSDVVAAPRQGADDRDGHPAGSTGARPGRPAAADLEERGDASNDDGQPSREHHDRHEERVRVGRAGDVVKNEGCVHQQDEEAG